MSLFQLGTLETSSLQEYDEFDGFLSTKGLCNPQDNPGRLGLQPYVDPNVMSDNFHSYIKNVVHRLVSNLKLY